jgi:hypothetical protein
MIIHFPHMLENFITPEENKILLDLSMNNQQVFDESSPGTNHPRWKDRVAYTSVVERHQPEVATLMYDITGRIHNYLSQIQPALTIYTEKLQFSRWITGDHLLPGHIDNCELDGSDNKSPWRHYGFILYLNDDFDGGELLYPNYNLIVNPRPRMLAVHTASPDCLHGVQVITSGTRHTLIGFATINRQHYNDNKNAYYNAAEAA